MKRVLFLSLLLLAGLTASQIGPAVAPTFFSSIKGAISLATMFCLAYIMIGVGVEFEIDKTKLGRYGWDAVVATSAAVLPWIFCALYFVFAMSPKDTWGTGQIWKESVLVSLFSAPTSAGVLFAMLSATGLSATWVFKKARILAIFDDLATIVLLIPLKIMLTGLRWQLGVIVVIIAGLLFAGWRYLHRFHWPLGWRWMLAYALGVVAASEAIYIGSKILDPSFPVHLEVLLPAFALGCVVAVSHHHAPSRSDTRVSDAIGATFMVLVGLSMPLISTGEGNDATARLGGAWPGWATIAFHVALITILSNVGKMFSFLCYRREASVRERLAVSVGMFPRGEVGAGVLVLSLSYGMGGTALTVAILSLAANLVLTGLFISIVKWLLARDRAHDGTNVRV